MKIITHHVLRQIASIFFIALCGFSGLYLIIDFFGKIDDIIENRAVLTDVLIYFLCKVPLMVSQILPVAMLLATVISFRIFHRNREIMVMQSAGCSPLVYTSPVIATSIILTIFNFIFSETVAFPMQHHAKQIWQQKIKHHKKSVKWANENILYHGENIIYQIHYYNHRTKALEEASLFYLDSSSKLMKRLDAKHILWQNNSWIAEEGRELDCDNGKMTLKYFDQQKLHLNETPKDFDDILSQPDNLNWLYLYRYTENLIQKGYHPTSYQVKLHSRSAFPFSVCVLTLLGIVIALLRDIQSSIAVDAGLALISAFAYFVVFQIGTSAASAGVLPPLAGVWAGNAIFGAVGCYYYLRLFK